MSAVVLHTTEFGFELENRNQVVTMKQLIEKGLEDLRYHYI